MNGDIKITIIMSLILIVIVFGIQWFFIRFTHWSIALIISAFIAFFLSFIYVSLSHATPNGGNYNIQPSEYIAPMILMFSVFTCSFCLICYLSRSYIPKIAYAVPLAMLFLMIVAFFISVFIKNNNTKLYKREICKIEVIGNTPIIDYINFRNNKNHYDLKIDMKKNNDINFERNKKNIASFPSFTNEIEFVCISTTSRTFFSQKFPFNYSLHKRNQVEIQGKEKEIRLKVKFKNKGKVAIHINENIVEEYQLEDELETSIH